MKASIKIVKSSAHIDRILKKGTKSYSNSFVLFCLAMPVKGLEFAAIAGKKVFRRAVDRNFAKRRIRHLIRTVCKDLDGMQIILMARGPMQTAKYCNLSSELKTMVAKIL